MEVPVMWCFLITTSTVSQSIRLCLMNCRVVILSWPTCQPFTGSGADKCLQTRSCL